MYYSRAMNAGGSSTTGSAPTMDHMVRGRVKELERKVQHLELVTQALWELVRDASRFTNEDIERKMNEIDSRDGVADGRVTTVPLRCPSCGRVSSSKHWKCLYCGLEFERDIL